MFPNPQNGLSLAKVIGGISKSLNTIQQIIPIYEQTKPMIQNARKAFSALKGINLNSNKTNQIKVSDTKKVNPQIGTNSNFNNPSFFK